MIAIRCCVVLLACSQPVAAFAQQTSTAQPSGALAVPTPAPNIDVRMIRMKISAGDLPSAESILESHRAEAGEDGDFVLGVA